MKCYRVVTFTVIFLLLIAASAVSSTAADPAPLQGNLAYNVELVDQVGGATYAIATQGDYAYVGIGPRVVILDLSDPAAPKMIGRSPVLSGVVIDLDISGNLVSVIVGDTAYSDWRYHKADRLHVLDVSNPGAPIDFGAHPIPGEASEVAISGQTVLVAGAGLHILDVSDPSQPVTKSVFGVSASSVTVAGPLAFVVSEPGELSIVDISDPAAPLLLGKYVEPGIMSDVSVVEGRAYLTKGHTYIGNELFPNGLRIVDVSDASHPVARGFIQLDELDRLAVAGDQVFAVQAGSLIAIDVSDPDHPELGSRFPVGTWAMAVATKNNFVLYSTPRNALNVVDFAAAAGPQLVGTFETVAPAQGVAASGTNVYLAEMGAVSTWRLEQGRQLQALGRLTLDGGHTAIAVRQERAYVAAIGEWRENHERGAGLHIIDLTNPAAPAEMGFLPMPSYARADVSLGSDANSGYAYVTTYWLGLSVVDIADPAHPRTLGVYPSKYVERLDVRGSLAYVINASYLNIVNVASPSQPMDTGVWFRGGPIRDIVVRENADSTRGYMAIDGFYAGNTSVGMAVVDLTDWRHPIPRGELITAGGAGVVVTTAGHYAFLVDRSSGLHVVDTSDADFPIEVGRYPRPAFGQDIAAELIDGVAFAFVAAGDSGLYVYRFQPPSLFHWYQEAENATVVPPVQRGNSPWSCGGKFVYTAQANSAGSVTFSFDVPVASSYHLWVRAMGFALDQNSFWVSIDGGPRFQYEIRAEGDKWDWQWERVHPEGMPVAAVPFEPGRHTIRFEAREASARLDTLLVANYGAIFPRNNSVCLPAGLPTPLPTATFTFTPTPTPTATFTPTSTATPTATPSGTPTPTPTATSTPTSTATPTASPSGTPTPTPTSSSTPTAVPTAVPSPV